MSNEITFTPEQLKERGFELVDGVWTSKKGAGKRKKTRAAKPRFHAKANIRKAAAGELLYANKTEERYAAMLETKRRSGEILMWMYEPFNLRLGAGRCFYKIDFMVILASGEIELHEVKGGGPIEDDSLVKWKAAANKYPFIFKMAQWKNKQWKERTL